MQGKMVRGGIEEGNNKLERRVPLKLALTATAVTALLLAGVAPARAMLMISLNDNAGHSASASDQTGQGFTSFIGSVGSFTINITGAASKPAIGAPTAPQLDLASLDIATTGGTLTIEVTDTGFLGNGNAYDFVSGVGGNNYGDSLTLSTFMDCGNAQFGMGTPIATQGYGGGAGSASTATQVKTCAGSYSLTEEVVLNFAQKGFTSFDASVSLPEPATLLLFGVGLVGIGAFLSRRQKSLL
jgi:hypothetical protein